MSTTSSRRLSRFALVLAVAFGVSCGGGGDGGTPPPAETPSIAINGGNGQQASIASAVPTAPSVKVATSNGAGVAGVTVTFAVASGGGSATGLTQTTNSSGIATVGSWTMGTALGANTLTATASGTTGGPLTFNANAVAGPATTIAVNAGNNQSAATGTAVATPPSVKVTDAGGNPVTGTSVTFAVASGGGSITGATQTTNSSGIATVGSWTLGASAGTNTLTATSTGLAGSPVTFTATASVGAPASPFTITSVSPALLTPGISATITGSGFSTTPATNIVTVDGVATTVTAATATQLTVTIPAAMPCEATHDATIAVSQTGATPATTTKPLQVASQRTLAVGQSLIVTAAAEQRCNELSNTGNSRYYVAVSNTNTVFSTTGAGFQVRGAGGSGASGLSPAAVTSAAARDGGRLRIRTPDFTPADLGAQAHMRLLDQNIRFLTENRSQFMTRPPRATRSIAVPVVGDQVSLNIPNIKNTTGSICQNPFPMTGRITYVGTRSIIVEDNANPMAGTIDTTYAQIGQEFDNVMFSVLQTSFGDPLAKDATTDNNGRIVMVFSTKVNALNTIAGFVVSCDLSPRNTTTNTTSNFGEYFYATAPTTSGTITTTGADAPPKWRWSMRATIIHEVKHIVSFAERIARNATAFEASWLEETTARMSEELYERAIYGFTQKSNILYGNTTNTGPYCGVRPTLAACSGRPRGIVRVFEELAPKWYTQPEVYSPLGRNDENDFAFYATGWSLLRWAIDQSTTAEATFIKALVQEATLSGVPNLEARTGRTFADMLPEWTMANVMDDYPGWVPAATTPASARMTQPSWNFRDVFSKYKADFGTQVTWAAWPLNPYARSFGAFTVDAAVKPGTSAIIELSGTAAAKQLLELKAQTGTAAAPTELRITIVRVQ